MKNRLLYGALAVLMTAGILLTGCGNKADNTAETAAEVAEDVVEEEATGEVEKDTSELIASGDETVEAVEVVEDGMTPITAKQLVDGTYDIEVTSSSEMFHIEAATLTVADGKMTCDMTMGGTGYLYLYMGTGAEAVTADEKDYIPFVEDGEVHHFVVPVEALDSAEDCAAFSKRKEKWYERQLCFRSDSLPLEAFRDDVFDTVASLELADGTYTVDAALQGGSGRASISSPATLTVAGGKATLTVEWSSPNFDYMIVGGEKYLPVNTDGNSTFEIPVEAFGYRMPVSADTTAMSTPHEIAYHITLDADSITE
ncbi:MAG: hypothetical protein K6A05_06015 [Lachnospiraceae bacterium]|nr:hypothetical protein [Lachnospiraceae bacterium]